MVPNISIFKKFKLQLNQIGKYINKQLYLLGGRKPWAKGYNDYKFEYIRKFISAEGLSCFKDKQLPSGYGYRLDERAVEYPWLMSRIKESERVVLDAGSALNFREILTSSQFKDRILYIDTLFFEGRPAVMPSPSYVYEDLRNMCFKDDFFDAICSLSTVEHIGFDNTIMYTPNETYKEECQNSYTGAIREFRRVLKPNGTLYVSVPFGKYKNHGWFQIFNSDMVEQIIQCFAPCSVEKTYYKYENNQWNISTEECCADSDFFDPHIGDKITEDYLAAARSVVCIELKKTI